MNMKTSSTSLLVILLLCAMAALPWAVHAATQEKEPNKEVVNPVQDNKKKEAQEEKKEDSKEVDATKSTKEEAAAEKKKKENVTSLFDGKSLAGWEIIEFGGEGEIELVDGVIRMHAGDPLTGICVAEGTELPKANYEVSLEAMKTDGSDFFCAITFPVNDTFCTMVVGGWGGTLVGLSSLDDRDASENSTRVNKKFAKNQWYTVRIQVLPERIMGWIDDEKLIDESIVDRKVGIRNDVRMTTPLGITSFITASSLRHIKIKKLD